MTTIKRGLRALTRNASRAGIQTVLLAVSIGLTLIMITVNEAFSERMKEIQSEVGSTVEVRPPGSFGPATGIIRPGQSTDDDTAPQMLSQEDAGKLTDIPNVVSISQTIAASSSIETNLQPARQELRFGANLDGQQIIPTTGTDNPNNLKTPAGGTVAVTAGRTFTEDEMDSNVAVVGETLAEVNGLTIGSTFEINGATLEVIGLSTGDQFFADIFLPLETAQRVLGQEGNVSLISLQVDSIDNVNAVADAVGEHLSTNDASVTTSLDRYEAIRAPLEDAQTSSRIGLVAALVASAAVILFGVVLAVRQRIREIGILKAIGAANRQVAAQFGVETLVVSLVGAVVGALATFPFADSVAAGLVADPARPAGPVTSGAISAGSGQPTRSFNLGGSLGDVSVAVSPEIFLYGLGVALILALIASTIPAWHIARVRPADVLRFE